MQRRRPSLHLCVGHWAIEVGDYTHELHLGRDKSISHFRGEWLRTPRRAISLGMPKSIVEHTVCGETQMTDRQIDKEGRSVEAAHSILVLTSNSKTHAPPNEDHRRWLRL